MEVFNLPNRCKIDKNIPKEMIYKNAEANEKLKRVFIDNVEKIRFMYLLNFSNSNIFSSKYLNASSYVFSSSKSTSAILSTSILPYFSSSF